MNQITVPPFGIVTTQFGFGCSSLLGLTSERESRALIDAAYDAGIRHFDVARSYGHGAAESLLGKTLGSRRGNVTITTKFGLPVPRQQAMIQAIRALARPVVKRLSRLRARSKAVVSGMATTVEFTAEAARESLATSLRELRSEQVALFLLHEASAGALADDRLLEYLQDSVRRGVIRGYGVGSDRAVLTALIASRPDYCPVVQHEWSVLTTDIEIPAGSSRICHGSLLRAFNTIRESMADPEYVRALNAAVGMDLGAAKNLAALLLRSAALQHPQSVTLFSARSPQRIQENLASLTNAKLDPYCAQLCKFLKNGA